VFEGGMASSRMSSFCSLCLIGKETKEQVQCNVEMNREETAAAADDDDDDETFLSSQDERMRNICDSTKMKHFLGVCWSRMRDKSYFHIRVSSMYSVVSPPERISLFFV